MTYKNFELTSKFNPNDRHLFYCFIRHPSMNVLRLKEKKKDNEDQKRNKNKKKMKLRKEKMLKQLLKLGKNRKIILKKKDEVSYMN